MLLPSLESLFKLGLHYKITYLQANQLLQPQNISLSQSVKSNLSVNEAALDIFKTLATDLDPQGRYLFLNAIANQLRYPNSHTAYFSDILCCLFSDAQQVLPPFSFLKHWHHNKLFEWPCSDLYHNL